MTEPAEGAARTTALEVCLRYLEAEGVGAVFGVPGGLLHPFFEAVENDPGLALFVAKHEEGAGFMADGWWRASRRLAVLAGTSGPGSTNMMTSVAVAFADGVPMLVLTGQVPSRLLGHGATQETGREDIDIVAMLRPVTKYSAMVTSAASLPHHLRRGLRLALTGRPGPVHLNVPVDLWAHEVAEDWFDPGTYRPRSTAFDRRAVQDGARALLEAGHPVILCGSGVGIAGAEEHLRALAELLPARVATTPRAKGLFPEDHPLSLGVLGHGGHRAAAETFLGDGVDVLLAAGASLNETATGWDPRLLPSGALLHLDVDADRVGRNYPVDIPLVGDAQTILVELVYHLHRHIRDGDRPRSRWREAPPVDRGPSFYDHPELRASDAVPLTPQRWRAELSEAMPPGALVFSDIGGHMLFNFHDLCIGGGRRFVVNLGFSSMGHGTAAVVGAALAVGAERPVLAIVGDACFTMNGMELLTAAEYGVPVVWIVENNQMHGITWHGSKHVGGGRPLESVRYRRAVDVAAIARAMGLRAWVVDRPGQLVGALDEALAVRGPAVLEVRVDGSIPPPLVDRARTVRGETA